MQVTAPDPEKYQTAITGKLIKKGNGLIAGFLMVMVL